MEFVTSLFISANWKDDNYNSILVIIDQFTKMVYYKPVKVTIDIPGLAKVVINVVMHHHKVLKLIITDRGLFFTSKF